VVLVKATVEAGQWEILRGYEPIVRCLIAILAVGSSLRAYCSWQ
jgi:pre-rRNA-processing protein RIX1